MNNEMIIGILLIITSFICGMYFTTNAVDTVTDCYDRFSHRIDGAVCYDKTMDNTIVAMIVELYPIYGLVGIFLFVMGILHKSKEVTHD